MLALIVPLVIGLAFGAILQRVGASSYELILGTLRLENLTILKFMLLAIGVAAVGIGGLSAFGLAHLAIKPLYLWGVLLGGLVFGVGFALSGYCPGTSLVACVEGRRDAWATVGGAFAGAIAYTLAYPFLRPLLVLPADFGKVTVTTTTGLSPTLAGLIGGGLFIALAFLLPRTPQRRAAAESTNEALQPNRA